MSHEIWKTCPMCDYEFDAHLHWTTCPCCGYDHEKMSQHRRKQLTHITKQ